MAAAAAASESGDGPVMSLITKKLRALRKKHNRILLLEESISNGKTLNKDQEEVLRTKPSVLTLIDEYEKLRQPLSAALQEELNTTPPAESKPLVRLDDESALEDLLKLLYFGVLFDLKPQSDFTNIMLTRTHERGCCLTYDYVTDDASNDLMLGERDFDLISMLGGKIVSRPGNSGLSHKNALQSCLQHAKLWLANADQPIEDGVDVTYAALRERLNKILASDYFTTTPEMKAPVEVAAAAAGKYVPVQASSVSSEVTESDFFAHLEQKEEEAEHSEGQETGADESSPVEELPKEESEMPSSVDGISVKQEIKSENYEEQQDFRDVESKDQQYNSRRGYQNYRGGNRGGGGGRRGYPNGRGGRNNRSGGYQNGRGQYYDQPGHYYPRNYNARGRGGAGRGAGGNGYNNHGSVGGSHSQGEEQQY